MNAPLRLPADLEERLAQIESDIRLLALALDLDLVDENLKRSPAVRHGLPTTAAEYDAYCRRLADGIEG